MNRNTIKSSLIDILINTDLDIDASLQRLVELFPNEDAELLGDVWVEVMEELPELN